MENQPLLSVIIPAYNVEKYIDHCLNTVTNQTYQNLEIILVDDGSPDNSGNIIDEWSKKDSRIKVIHKENGGLGFARNSGLEIATGDYIAFIDSDDYIDLNMYETLINKAIETKSDIVYCGFHKGVNYDSFEDISDFSTEITFNENQILDLSLAFVRKNPIIAKEKLAMSVWHSIYRKNVIKVNFYSERVVGSEDLHFQISAVLNSKQITFIPDCLYYYRYNGNSLSHNLKFDIYFRYKRLREYINALFIEKGVNNVADYLMLYITITYLRSKFLNNSPNKEIKAAISDICDDGMWNSIFIDSKSINFQENTILSLITAKKKKSLYLLFVSYYFLYKLKKQIL
ncbi:MAG: glycosyltransferase [Muribaculaceae bacterium]